MSLRRWALGHPRSGVCAGCNIIGDNIGLLYASLNPLDQLGNPRVNF